MSRFQALAAEIAAPSTAAWGNSRNAVQIGVTTRRGGLRGSQISVSGTRMLAALPAITLAERAHRR